MSHWRTAHAAAVVALLVVVLGCSADKPESAVPPNDDGPASNEANDGEGAYRFLCTGDLHSFRELGTRLLQMPLGAEHVGPYVIDSAPIPCST